MTKTMTSIPGRCEDSVNGGDYICTLPKGHANWHRNEACHTSWPDADSDEPTCVCAHTNTTMEVEPDLWRCDSCRTVLREVDDPINGTTWTDTIPSTGGRKVRYEVVG